MIRLLSVVALLLSFMLMGPTFAAETGAPCSVQLSNTQWQVSVMNRTREVQEREYAETLRLKREKEAQVDRLTAEVRKMAEELAETKEKLKKYEAGPAQ